jgi:hypothetical protein
MLSDDIHKLEQELAAKKKLMAQCPHQFPKEPQFDPEEYTDLESTGNLIGNGSDPYYETRPVKRKRDRWSLTCTVCGYVKYTTQQEVIKTYKPKF